MWCFCAVLYIVDLSASIDGRSEIASARLHHM